MTALAADRMTALRSVTEHVDPVAAGKRIYAGAIVLLNATAFAQPATAAAGLVSRGVALEGVDNSTGADGAVNVRTRKGTFKLTNAGDIVRTNLKQPAYAVDDQTVSASSSNNTRTQIGVIDDIDADGGIWVTFS